MITSTLIKNKIVNKTTNKNKTVFHTNILIS